MKISRLRHQPDSYSPFCLLVLRPTLRIQTQGRSAEKRETRSLYREGCGGGRQEMTAGSCIAHLWEGTAVGAGGGRRGKSLIRILMAYLLTFIYTRSLWKTFFSHCYIHLTPLLTFLCSLSFPPFVFSACHVSVCVCSRCGSLRFPDPL